MLKAYFVLTFYYAIYCTVQHHRILLYIYGAIEINKHLHLTIWNQRSALISFYFFVLVNGSWNISGQRVLCHIVIF